MIFMAVAQPATLLEVYLAIAFFLLVFALLGCYATFARSTAPRALDLWANEHGYKVIQKREVGPFKRLSIGASRIQMVYEVTLVDPSGVTHSGLIKLGHYGWLSFSSKNCPIEVYLNRSKKSDWPPEL